MFRHKDNIYSNPRGWAQHIVGTTLKYRLMQVCFFVYASIVIFSSWACSAKGPHDLGWWVNFGLMCWMAIFGMIVWPLMLLRSLRAWVPPKDEPRGFEVVTKTAD